MTQTLTVTVARPHSANEMRDLQSKILALGNILSVSFDYESLPKKPKDNEEEKG